MKIIKNSTKSKIFDREIKCEVCKCVFQVECGDNVISAGSLQGYPNYEMVCPSCNRALWVTHDNDESEYPLIGLPL